MTVRGYAEPDSGVSAFQIRLAVLGPLSCSLGALMRSLSDWVFTSTILSPPPCCFAALRRCLMMSRMCSMLSLEAVGQFWAMSCSMRLSSASSGLSWLTPVSAFPFLLVPASPVVLSAAADASVRPAIVSLTLAAGASFFIELSLVPGGASMPTQTSSQRLLWPYQERTAGYDHRDGRTYLQIAA